MIWIGSISVLDSKCKHYFVKDKIKLWNLLSLKTEMKENGGMDGERERRIEEGRWEEREGGRKGIKRKKGGSEGTWTCPCTTLQKLRLVPELKRKKKKETNSYLTTLTLSLSPQ